jgi:hypothetical protein
MIKKKEVKKKIFEPKGPKVKLSKVGKGKPLYSISHPVEKAKENVSKSSKATIKIIKGKKKGDAERTLRIQDFTMREYLKSPSYAKALKKFTNEIIAGRPFSNEKITTKRRMNDKKFAPKKRFIDQEGIIDEIHHVANEKGYLILYTFKNWVFFIKKIKVSINRELNQEGFQPYQNKEDKEIWTGSVINCGEDLNYGFKTGSFPDSDKINWIARLEEAGIPFHHVQTVEGVEAAMEKY